MNWQTWPAIITLLNLALLVWVGAMVGAARGKYQVPAPATTGNPLFERAFRVQMNTLENTVLFLPALWLAALEGGPAWLVSAAGLIWIGARVLYALAYARDPAKRGPGFAASMLAVMVLAIDAGLGLARALAG